MWQVSGRSDITDFEEVVRLDTEYISSMVIDGNAVGHYFTVAQNYLDLFKSACNVKIAGGPVYKDKFKEEDLLLLDYNAESSCSSIENKRRELCNLRKLFDLCKSLIQFLLCLR